MHIYKTTNLINNKIYIGQEKGNNPKYLGSGKILQIAIKKYGVENFKKEILQECKDQEELNKAEIYWINNSNCFQPKGYNICNGNFGGDNFTNNPNKEEIRKKLSDKAHGWIFCNWSGKTHSEESKQKMRLSKKGKSSRGKGWHHTDETKEKFSITRKGKAPRGSGWHQTEETKHKLSQIKKPEIVGENNPSKNPEVRRKISEKKKEFDKIKIKCEYCNKEFTKPNYIKSHGIKCKLNDRSTR